MANEVLDANKAGSLWLSQGLLERFRQISQTGKGELRLSHEEATELGLRTIVLDPHLVHVLSSLARSSITNQQPQSQTNAEFSGSAIHRLAGHGMHRLGRAVDISRHEGFRINVFQEEEALKGVLSIIKLLPLATMPLDYPGCPRTRRQTQSRPGRTSRRKAGSTSTRTTTRRQNMIVCYS